MDRSLVDQRIDTLFDELVPPRGKSDSLAGELVRATCRIGYRFYNDGDQIGIGYGKETCNAAARFLIENLPDDGAQIAINMWAKFNEQDYEKLLYELIEYVADYVENTPSLRNEPTEDMLDYADPDEDRDDPEEEEEWS